MPTLWEWIKALPVLLVCVIFAVGSAIEQKDWLWRHDSDRLRKRRQIASQAPIDTIQGWIKDCDSHSCLKQKVLKFHLPTRVIDITDFKKKRARRIFLKSSQGLVTERYICLSYCWGGHVPLLLLKENKSQMEDSIALESLPILFHDFITVAAALGARYVWIDALCIIQDDPEDWEKEAASMNLVYGNSYLTIAATAAPDPTYSLLPERLSHGVFVVGISLARSAFLDPGFLHHGDKDSKWSTRGWTFQEYLLSARVLHFGESELVWHCNEDQRCECGNVKATQSLREAQMAQLRGVFKLAVRKFLPKKNWTAQNRDRQAEKIAAWHICAELYSERALSNRAEHVIAISGIAEAFTEAQLGPYYAGSWEASFSEDLCWQPRRDSGIQKAPAPWKPDYLAPSWSWLATGRPVTFHHKGHGFKTQIVVETCQIMTESSRQWAKVIGGYAKINALGVRIPLAVDSKRKLYIHPEYLNQHAGILAHETEGEPCGTLDNDPTIQEETHGISGYCLLATTHEAQPTPNKGPLMTIGTLIVMEKVPSLTTPHTSTHFDSLMEIPTPTSMGGRLKLLLQEKFNLLNPPTYYPPIDLRRIGILKVRMDFQQMVYLHPRRNWNII